MAGRGRANPKASLPMYKGHILRWGDLMFQRICQRQIIDHFLHGKDQPTGDGWKRTEIYCQKTCYKKKKVFYLTPITKKKNKKRTPINADKKNADKRR